MLTDAFNRPQVKILGSRSVLCQHPGCETQASFLFRIERGPITGCCEVHARQLAASFGIELPEAPMNRIRKGWKDPG
jgi:hypothetical protein